MYLIIEVSCAFAVLCVLSAVAIIVIMKKRNGGGAAATPEGKAKGQMELQLTIENLMKRMFVKEVQSNANPGPSSSGSSSNPTQSQSEPQQKVLPPILLKKNGQPDEEFKLLALSNDLIWNNITKYLTHNELKKTSLVCKNFFQRIRVYKRFQDSSVVRLRGGHFLSPHFRSFKDDVSLIWKSIEIDIDLPLNTFVSQNISAVRKRFQYTESMKIYLWHISTILEMHGPFLKIVLAATTPSLKSLTLHCVLLGHNDLQGTLDDPLVQVVLHNLDELHISTGKNRNSSIGTIYDSKLKPGGQTLNSNLKKLVSFTNQLKSFSWGRIDISPKVALLSTVFALHFVESNATTLTTLSLELYPWCIEFIKDIVCPNIRNLKIFARFKNYKHVVGFIEKQPPLVTLDLEFRDAIPLEVAETVGRVHGQTLKKLRLKCEDLLDEPAVLRILSRMSQLEACDLQIAQYESHTTDDFSTACVLKALPKTISQLTLRRLYSGGMDVICDHACPVCPAFQFCDCEPAYMCTCLPRPQAENNIARLQLFVNLTELTVINRSVKVDYDMSMSDESDGDGEEGNDEGMIDDPMLQFIIENLKKLKILRFAHCWTLTNFGLTGCLPNGQKTGTAINALTDLRELVMKDCPLLEDPALLRVIKFPRLTSLYMIIREPENPSHNNLPSKQILAGITKQNPCLASITIHSNVANIEKILKAANPALVRVFNAHTENCGSGVIDGDKNYFHDPYEDYVHNDEEGYTTSEEAEGGEWESSDDSAP